jgi:hypothetical protein
MSRLRALAAQPKTALGVLVTVLIAATAVAGSGANFTASSANPANTFSAGTLSIANSRAGTAILTPSDLRPGEPAQAGLVDIENDGSLSGAFTLSRGAVTDSDGTYSVRVVVDNAGVKTTSVPSPITIDNTAPTAVDIQAANGGATPGRLEAGDAVTLTWSEPIAPASVLAGWSGASQAIRVRVTNVAANDQLDFYDATGTTRLGLVTTTADLKLGADYVTADAEFDATMALSANAITITLGSQRSGAVTTAAAGTMTWGPSAGRRTCSATRAARPREPRPARRTSTSDARGGHPSHHARDVARGDRPRRRRARRRSAPRCRKAAGRLRGHDDRQLARRKRDVRRRRDAAGPERDRDGAGRQRR